MVPIFWAQNLVKPQIVIYIAIAHYSLAFQVVLVVMIAKFGEGKEGFDVSWHPLEEPRYVDYLCQILRFTATKYPIYFMLYSLFSNPRYLYSIRKDSVYHFTSKVCR